MELFCNAHIFGGPKGCGDAMHQLANADLNGVALSEAGAGQSPFRNGPPSSCMLSEATDVDASSSA